MRSLFIVFLLTTVPLSAAAQQNDARMLRVEQWLKAVLHHQPGEVDEPVDEIGSLVTSELQALWLDTAALAQLMREPRESFLTIRTSRQSKPQQVRFTPNQLRRMRVLACAAAGILDTPFCSTLKPFVELDDELLRLAQQAAASRAAGDPHDVLRRGALLHADAGMWSKGHVFDEALVKNSIAPQRLTIGIVDGRSGDTYRGGLHWDIGRSLLESVRPAGDPMVRAWYRATAAWMQAQDYHENSDHLTEALRLFPKDADLLLLSGAEHEGNARASIQAAVRTIALPPGFELSVRAADVELRTAETHLRQALVVAPRLVEARLRLGRVLFLRGQLREAAEFLRQAQAEADEDLLKYYGRLFLGSAEEALGNYDAAAAHYLGASDLFPSAQSPHLARSALARRRGDRAGALAAMGRVFELAQTYPENDDPWWTYHVAQGRQADDLLQRLRAPFVETK